MKYTLPHAVSPRELVTQILGSAACELCALLNERRVVTLGPFTVPRYY